MHHGDDKKEIKRKQRKAKRKTNFKRNGKQRDYYLIRNHDLKDSENGNQKQKSNRNKKLLGALLNKKGR